MDATRRSSLPDYLQTGNIPMQPDICNDFRTINGISGGIRRFNTSASPLRAKTQVGVHNSTAKQTPQRRNPKIHVGLSKSMHVRDKIQETPRKENLDRTFAITGLSVGLVAGTVKNEPFGHPLYRAPIVDVKYRIAMGSAPCKEKNRNFADKIAERRSFVHGPKYVSHTDWRETFKGRRGKFLGAPRTTFTDEVMKFEKNKPAPNAFDNKEILKKLQKIEGSYTFKDTRVHKIDHVKWLTQQVPPAKYVVTNVKLTKPRTLGMTWGKVSTPAGTQAWVIPKVDQPGPGSYKVAESITNGLWGKIKGTTKKQENPPSFTDRHKKMLAFVPGPGHNKIAEAGKDKAAKDINFKYKRH